MEHLFGEPLRALELSDGSAAFCGRMLALFGVEVVKVEPPGGDPARVVPPWAGGDAASVDLAWLAYNTGKKSVTLDLDDPGAREDFLRLVESADFVIEALPVGYLDRLGIGYEALTKRNPRLILTSITPFGQDGPYATYAASDITVLALGGLLDQNGEADRPPLRFGVGQADPLAGAQAAAATLIAHESRARTGVGQHIDVSAQEAVLAADFMQQEYWDILAENPVRMGGYQERSGVRMRMVFPSRDGFVAWRLMFGAHGYMTRAVVDWMLEEGDGGSLADVDWRSLDIRQLEQERVDQFETVIGAFFAARPKAVLFSESIRRGIGIFPISSAADLMADEQFTHREFWRPVEQPLIGAQVLVPGRPFVTGVKRDEPDQRPAPRPGEHTGEVFSGERGDAQVDTPDSDNPSGGALAHVNVLDLGWVIAVPLATKILAEHGATVVRLESASRLDLARSNLPNVGEPGVNRCAFFAAYNNDKYGLTLDLTNPAGGPVLERLIAWADVVVENFRAGTLERLGMSPERLREINPGVTIIRSTLFGQEGPNRHVAGFGGTMAALTGFTGQVGWPDRPPSGTPVPYPDFLSPWWLVGLVTAGLACRRATGEGAYFDLSQAEASAHFLAPWFMEQAVTGSASGARGNRSPVAAPHGVFPCAGDDRWCALAVTDEREWAGLVAAMGDPPWAREARFGSMQLRKANESELEQLLAAWTLSYAPRDLMRKLQANGVPAGAVLDGQGLHEDPQLAHRGHFVRLEHPEMGLRAYDAPSFRLSRQPAQLRRAAHLLGQHNEQICREFLGLSDEDFVELIVAGALD